MSGSERASRLFLVTFGSYYALDATFYLLNGFVNDLPWMSDIMLNLPHVVVSTFMLAAAYGVTAASGPREALYAADRVRREEAVREATRREQMAAFRRRFVDGPVLRLPATEALAYGFNPNGVVPFEDVGTVYLTASIRDEWGSLEVTRGGALIVRTDGKISHVIVPAEPEGWKLELAPGWEIAGGTVRRR